MELRRLQLCDGSWAELEADWQSQCDEIVDDYENYCFGPIESVKRTAAMGDENEWAFSIKENNRHLITAICRRVQQKPFDGWVLRVREVSVSPFLDSGFLNEDVYADVLVALLFEAIKLSSTYLMADHVKMHLRSPADAVFFKAVRNSLDIEGVIVATETHGAWFTVSKKPRLTVI